MEQGFPPDYPPIAPTVVFLHVLMLGLLLGAIAALLIQLRRKTTGWDVLAWFFGGVILVIATSTFVVPIMRDIPETRSFGVGLLLTVVALCLIGLVQSVIRLQTKSRANVAVGAMACLAGLVIVVPCLMPATPHAREAARRTQCRNNLKQLGLALHNYNDYFHSLPPTAAGEPAASWRVLPYIDQAPLYNAYDFTRAWDESPDADFLQKPVPVLWCPSVRRIHDEQGRYFSSYIAPTGVGTPFGLEESRSIEDITDGTSHTLLLVEACGLEILWTDPRDFDVTRGPVGINLKGHGQTDSPGLLSSYHRGGTNVLMADGSVRFLSQKTDPAVLNALLTADGGDDPGEDW